MVRRTQLTRCAGRSLAGAALVAAMATSGSAQGSVTGPSGWVNPLAKRYVSGPPIQVCDQGSFFVGGVPKVTTYAASATNPNGAPEQLIIGQMYVQFQIPQVRRGWPLVMVHGSGYSGAALDATPDGREGWFAYAVRNGIATFVVDQPGRGRSGFDRSIFHEARVTGNLSLIPTLAGGTSNAVWTSWFGHLIPAGSNILNGTLIRHGDPGDPDPPEGAVPSPAHGSYPPLYPIPPVPNSIDPKIAAREGALGPAPNPANNDYLALQSFKQLVPNTEVTLPGSFCAACSQQNVAPSNTWSPRALADLLEGLGGAIVSPHSQASAQALHLIRILKERGKLHLIKGLLIPEGGTDLAAAGLEPKDFDNIPVLIVNGDYRASAIRQGNWAARDAINASPTRTVSPMTVIDVDAVGFEGGRFLGTTHMEMLGTNQLEIFDLMLDWVKKNVPDQPKATSCSVGKK